MNNKSTEKRKWWRSRNVGRYKRNERERVKSKEKRERERKVEKESKSKERRIIIVMRH